MSEAEISDIKVDLHLLSSQSKCHLHIGLQGNLDKKDSSEVVQVGHASWLYLEWIAEDQQPKQTK
jgi:hypothetical protein